MVLFQKIPAPIVGLAPRAAFDHEDRAICGRDDAGQSSEGLAVRRFQPLRLRPCRINRREPAPGDANQQAAVRMQRQTTGGAVEGRDDVAPSKFVARQLQNLVAGRDIDLAIVSSDDIVGAGQGLANRQGRHRADRSG